MLGKLIIMVGVPGSGKSTIAKTIENADIISSDDIREKLYGSRDIVGDHRKTFGIMTARTFASLKKGKTVIYDATNLTKSGRIQTIKRFKDSCESVEALYISVPVELAKTRNASRKNIVPEEIIDRMYGQLQVPTEEEGFDKVVIIDNVA